MLNRRILRVKAMQALYGYHLAIESLREIAAEELADHFKWDPAIHDSLDKKHHEQQQRLVKKHFFDSLKGLDPTIEDEEMASLVKDHLRILDHRIADEHRAGRKRMEEEIQNIYHLYLKLLLIPSEVAFVESQEKDRRAKSLTSKDGGFGYHYMDNPLIKALSTFQPLLKETIDKKISWDAERNELRGWYKDIWSKNESFQSYQALKSPSEEEHVAAARHLTKQLLFKEEIIDEYMASQDLHWSENKSIVRSMVTKTVQSFEPGLDEPFELKSLSLNEADDFKYFRVLFDETIKKEHDFEALLAGKTKNWDMSRVATLDKMILKLALTEMINFPSIPVKVTINEFIEISKQYSTPKSKQFINGILDVLANELTSDGTIKKSGRGLIDNK